MSIFNSITSALKHLRAGMRPNPSRDWSALLTFSSIVLAAIIVWNLWAFDTVARGGVIGTTATSTTKAFNRDSLDAIHTIFTNRADEELKYETGVYRYVDPSQ